MGFLRGGIQKWSAPLLLGSCEDGTARSKLQLAAFKLS